MNNTFKKYVSRFKDLSIIKHDILRIMPGEERSFIMSISLEIRNVAFYLFNAVGPKLIIFR